ncbi:MAG: zinc transporter ZntB [Phycisphaerae bacterium]|nr:zinc transporter ZntB [Phycisphaerae bacterium]
MSLNDALVFAYRFDDAGHATALDAGALDAPPRGPGWTWAHIDRAHANTEPWLRNTARLSAIAIDALLEEETRPRSVPMGDGMVVILRGVNLNAGADPEDMVSLRLWVDASRVISLRHRRVMAVQDLRDCIDRGESVASPAALLIEIAGRLIQRMGPVLDHLNDAVDEVEEAVLEAPGNELRSKLSKLRRQAISLRRFLAPQREALLRLETDRSTNFRDVDRGHLREIAERLTRHIEALDSARDRAAVTQEELAGRISDQMNRNMYVLSLVAGIFLPLGLLTGLLGMNVGGMPGVDNNWGFAIVCAVLVALAGFAVWLFRRLRIM